MRRPPAMRAAASSCRRSAVTGSATSATSRRVMFNGVTATGVARAWDNFKAVEARFSASADGRASVRQQWLAAIETALDDGIAGVGSGDDRLLQRRRLAWRPIPATRWAAARCCPRSTMSPRPSAPAARRLPAFGRHRPGGGDRGRLAERRAEGAGRRQRRARPRRRQRQRPRLARGPARSADRLHRREDRRQRDDWRATAASR